MSRGLFLVFDGLDGTGKTTQIRRLTEWLRARSIPVTATRDPGGTDLAMRLREIVLHGRQHDIGVRTEALIFGAARADLVDHVIRPALARGEVVLSDRYALANVVYQGHAGGIDPDRLREIESFVTDGEMPSLTLIFDLPEAEAATRRRRENDRMESKGPDYLDRVRKGFRAEAMRDPQRVVLIDASGTVDEVFERVLGVIQSVLVQSGYPI
jgi:dTMP kinase